MKSSGAYPSSSVTLALMNVTALSGPVRALYVIEDVADSRYSSLRCVSSIRCSASTRAVMSR
jgi:hypothetical protein